MNQTDENFAIYIKNARIPFIKIMQQAFSFIIFFSIASASIDAFSNDNEKFTNSHINPSLKQELEEIGSRNVVKLKLKNHFTSSGVTNEICSGFFISSNTVVTNAHCVKGLFRSGGCRVVEKGPFQTNDKCKLTRYSTKYDLATIQTQNHHQQKKLSIAHNQSRKNTYFYSISYPGKKYSINKLKYLDKEKLIQTYMNAGVLSQDFLEENLLPDQIYLEGNIQDQTFIQKGSSGGLLLNDNLEIIGAISGVIMLPRLSKEEMVKLRNKVKVLGQDSVYNISKNRINEINKLQAYFFSASGSERRELIKQYRLFVVAHPIEKLYTATKLADALSVTHLHRVVLSEDQERIKTLLEEGVDVNAKNHQGDTSLSLYVRHSSFSLDIIKLLLQAGAKVNLVNDSGYTALHLAVRFSRSKEVIKTLLRAGANINLKDKQGQNVLHYAYGKSPEIIKFLIQAGADTQAQDNIGYTPFHRFVALSSGFNVSEVAQIFAEEGAYIEDKIINFIRDIQTREYLLESNAKITSEAQL